MTSRDEHITAALRELYAAYQKTSADNLVERRILRDARINVGRIHDQ